jgi:DNA/RNA-binding domain of Phe-tRNA-synthetase-like protein
MGRMRAVRIGAPLASCALSHEDDVMTVSTEIIVAPDVTGIVRPASLLADSVRVVSRDERMDAPLIAAAERLRVGADAAEITTAVRAMYKRCGIDPTKTRPSSEALLRRVRRGDPLPRVNSLVDVINWCSAESQLPFGLYDRAQIHGPVTLRFGRADEAYPGIRKDLVHVAGRLTLVDDLGPFGNPTSDSERTMVTTATVSALVVIYAPASVSAAIADAALRLTGQRIREYCSA